MRETTLKRVVLPAPFGPISPQISLSSIVNDRSSRATTPPKRTEMLRTSSSAKPALPFSSPPNDRNVAKIAPGRDRRHTRQVVSGLGAVRANDRPVAPDSTVRARLVPEVLELQGDAEVGALEQGDDRLQVITLLRADPNGLALGLAGRALRGMLLDQLVDLAGLVARDPDLDRGHLAHAVVRGLLHVAVLQSLQGDAALDELLLEHDAQRRQPVLAHRAQREHEVLLLDRGVGVLEVEARADLPLRLVDGVADLLVIDL